MAVKIPQYENRLVPQGSGVQANMQVATPVDETGKMLQSIGDTGFKIAGLLQKKEDDDAVANIGPSIAESSAYWPSRVTALADGSKDGGYVTNNDGSTSTLVHSVTTEFNDWESKFLGGITNAKARQYAQQHINSMRASTLHAALTTEARLGVENRTAKVDDAVNVWASQSIEGGFDVGVANMAQADSLIANIGLPEGLRNDKAQKARAIIAEAVIRGEIVRNGPEVQDAILARLNATTGYSQQSIVPEQGGAGYGNRPDGTPKGNGWLGPIKTKSGEVMTELTVGVNLDGKETNIPAIVPTLTKDEVAYLADGNKPTDAIMDKAVAHAKQRIAQGKSPYADTPAAAPASVTLDQLWPGLIKQESGGKQSAVSTEGAIGVAQITPGTAPEAAKLAGLPYDANRLKTDAAYNEALGKAYLQKQMDTFGDPAKALGAYNAGPGRVKSLIAKYGEDWLSHAPKETQNYVASIMATVTPAAPADVVPAGGVDKTVAVVAKAVNPNVARVVDALPPEKLVPYLNAAREESTRQDASFRAQILTRENDDMARVANGDPVQTPLTMQDFTRAYPVDGAQRYDNYTKALQLGADIQQVRTMPVTQQQAFLAARKPDPASPGYALAVNRYDALAKAVDSVNSARLSDPIAWAGANRIGNVQPLNFNDQQAFAAEMKNRVGVARMMQQTYGVQTPTLLSKAEQQTLLAGFGNMTSQQKLAYLGTIRNAVQDPESYRAVINSIAPDSPVTAMAGIILTKPKALVAPGGFLRSETVYTPNDVAATMLEGEALLNPSKSDKKENGVGKAFPMPKDKDMRAQFMDYVGTAFAGDATGADYAYQGVKAYYAGAAARAGDYSGETNSKLLQNAINAVIGGVSDVNGNGDVIRPWGMSADFFENMAKGAFNSAIAANGYTGTALDNWGAYGLQNAGDGKYLVRAGSGYLLGKDGQPIVLNVGIQQQPVTGIPGSEPAPAAAMPSVNQAPQKSDKLSTNKPKTK